MRDSPSNNFKPFDCSFDKAKTVPIERSKFSQVIPEECSAEDRASGKVCNQLLLTDKKLPLPISRILHTCLVSYRLGCSDRSFVVRGLSPERQCGKWTSLMGTSSSVGGPWGIPGGSRHRRQRRRPAKHSSGPTMNTLIKLMSMISLIRAPLLIKVWG